MKKIPIDFSKKLYFFLYNYSKKEFQHRILKKSENCPIETGQYWIPEEYKIVEINEHKFLKYKKDGYIENKEDLKQKWIEGSKMKQDLSRFHIEVTKIEEQKLSKINKTQSLLEGMSSTDVPINPEEDKKLKNFNQVELERFKIYWENQYGEWDKDSMVWVINYKLSHVIPKYPNFKNTLLKIRK